MRRAAQAKSKTESTRSLTRQANTSQNAIKIGLVEVIAKKEIEMIEKIGNKVWMARCGLSNSKGGGSLR